jgi:hypothetical protein
MVPHTMQRHLEAILASIEREAEQQHLDASMPVVAHRALPHFTVENQDVARFNAITLLGKKRKNRKPYMIHPLRIAYDVAPFFEDSERIINYALTHDLLDEALQYDAVKLAAYEQALPCWSDVFNSAKLLCPPPGRIPVDDSEREVLREQASFILHEEDREMRVATVRQVLLYGTAEEATILLYDKLDHSGDLNYLRKPEEKHVAARRFLSRAQYTLQVLEQLIPENAKLAAQETIEKRCALYNISRNHLFQAVNCLRDAEEKSAELINQNIQQHLEKHQFKPPIVTYTSIYDPQLTNV